MPGHRSLDAVKAEIRTRGYWSLVIHPTKYDSNRVPFSELEAIVLQSKVSRRNWGDFPWVDPGAIERGSSKISGVKEMDVIRQAWEFHCSGQFVAVVGIFDDWLDRSRILRPESRWAPMQRLPIGQTLVQSSYLWEFASRLAVTLQPYSTEEIVVTVTVHGLENRVLWVDDPRRIPFVIPYQTQADEIPPFTRELSVPLLVARWSELSLECSANIFTRFGWTPPIPFLQDIQQTFGG